MKFNEVKREETGTRHEWECTGHSSAQALCAGAPTREVRMVLLGEEPLTSVPRGLLQLFLACASNAGCSGRPKGLVSVMTWSDPACDSHVVGWRSCHLKYCCTKPGCCSGATHISAGRAQAPCVPALASLPVGLQSRSGHHRLLSACVPAQPLPSCAMRTWGS